MWQPKRMSKGKPDAADEGVNRLGGLARRLATRALGDPRVQEATLSLKTRAESLRSGVRDRADERLEALIESRSAGGHLSGEVEDALHQRRVQREERQAKQAAREAVLAVATTSEERRVLLRVLEGTAWAGGERDLPRYTALLDALAAGGSAEQEMAVHRAIWSLAEREVLSVSPHGLISAVNRQSNKVLALPSKVQDTQDAE